MVTGKQAYEEIIKWAGAQSERSLDDDVWVILLELQRYCQRRIGELE